MAEAIVTATKAGVSALMFAILTATRSGEVRGARWDEFDLDGDLDHPGRAHERRPAAPRPIVRSGRRDLA